MYKKIPVPESHFKKMKNSFTEDDHLMPERALSSMLYDFYIHICPS